MSLCKSLVMEGAKKPYIHFELLHCAHIEVKVCCLYTVALSRHDMTRDSDHDKAKFFENRKKNSFLWSESFLPICFFFFFLKYRYCISSHISLMSPDDKTTLVDKLHLSIENNILIF